MDYNSKGCSDDISGYCLCSPRYPDMKQLYERIRSFESWPKALKQRPQELAQAGLFYSGVGDKTVCFYCAGGIENWDATDEPWREHAKWYPNCEYLRLCKGDDCIMKMRNELPSPPQNTLQTDGVKFSINENEKEETETRTICEKCSKNEKEVVVFPCKHVSVCERCAVISKECPRCGKDVEHFLKVYCS